MSQRPHLSFFLLSLFSLALPAAAHDKEPVAELQVTLDDAALAGLAGTGAFARVSVDIDGEAIEGVVNLVAAEVGAKDVAGFVDIGRGCTDDRGSVTGVVVGTISVPALSRGGTSTGNVNVVVNRVAADGACSDAADEAVVSVSVAAGASSKLIGSLGATTGGGHGPVVLGCSCICTYKWPPMCRCDCPAR